MKFYLAGKYTNKDFVHTVAEGLRKLGHSVFDFADNERRQTKVSFMPKDKKYNGNMFDAFCEMRDCHGVYEVLAEQFEAIQTCDALVLILPAGIDSHFEYGLAVGMGKTTIAIGYPSGESLSLSYAYLDYLFDGLDDFLKCCAKEGY